MAVSANRSSESGARAGRSPGASAHSLGMADKIRAYLAHHVQVGVQTLRNLLGTWLTSLMTWLVIGIAMALPAILFILLANIGSFGGDWDGKARISLYLDFQVTEHQALGLSQEILADEQVAAVNYMTASHTLSEFTSQTGFGDVLASLPANPLPAVIEVEPGVLSPAEIRILVQRLEARHEVESISVDLEWIERLFALLSLAQRFVASLAIFLGMGVLLAIGNTIRLAIENRRDEIEVVKLVGGTDRFVRRPFLYLGFWYGLGGAVTAWLMVQASFIFLAAPIERLIHAYQDDFVLRSLGFGETGILLGSGAMLGVLGAALAVSRHLHQIEPR